MQLKNGRGGSLNAYARVIAAVAIAACTACWFLCLRRCRAGLPKCHARETFCSRENEPRTYRIRLAGSEESKTELYVAMFQRKIFRNGLDGQHKQNPKLAGGGTKD